MKVLRGEQLGKTKVVSPLGANDPPPTGGARDITKQGKGSVTAGSRIWQDG